MRKKSLKSLSNVAPKTLATLLVVMALNSCDGTTDHKMSQMTASEREDYEMYGFVPDDIQKSKSADNKTLLFAIGSLALTAIGIGIAVQGTDQNNKQR